MRTDRIEKLESLTKIARKIALNTTSPEKAWATKLLNAEPIATLRQINAA